jgi:hypothetical protein
MDATARTLLRRVRGLLPPLLPPASCHPEATNPTRPRGGAREVVEHRQEILPRPGPPSTPFPVTRTSEARSSAPAAPARVPGGGAAEGKGSWSRDEDDVGIPCQGPVLEAVIQDHHIGPPLHRLARCRHPVGMVASRGTSGCHRRWSASSSSPYPRLTTAGACPRERRRSTTHPATGVFPVPPTERFPTEITGTGTVRDRRRPVSKARFRSRTAPPKRAAMGAVTAVRRVDATGPASPFQ